MSSSIVTLIILHEIAPPSFSVKKNYGFQAGCDFYDGTWIRNSSRRIYDGKKCKWLFKKWNCELGKGYNFDHSPFNWRPKDCEYPIERLRDSFKLFQNKSLSFVGDSLARQQFQSLLCMIDFNSSSPQESKFVESDYFMGFERKNGILPDRESINFIKLNLTISFLVSLTLCETQQLESNKGPKSALHLDRVNSVISNLVDKSDFVVFSTGHHWNKNDRGGKGWIMYLNDTPVAFEGLSVEKELEVSRQICLKNVVSWLDKKLLEKRRIGRKDKSMFFLRSISPSHFENGDWNSGGSCRSTEMNADKGAYKFDEDFSLQVTEESSVMLLNITALSGLQKEAHIADFDFENKRSGGMDCVHWCLPGVPDAWNEVLLWEILRSLPK